MENTMESTREKIREQKYISFKKNIFQYNVSENIFL
jgi:hypothetical protein